MTKCNWKVRIVSDWFKQCIRECNGWKNCLEDCIIRLYCMKPMVCSVVLYDLWITQIWVAVAKGLTIHCTKHHCSGWNVYKISNCMSSSTREVDTES